mmetsp:Transcript_8325/g.25002  ORF Transcript_8325/g.25002 Transcript_8325/m.25002 type:complete len:164 (+) Transcript_8325:255-746(+)
MRRLLLLAGAAAALVLPQRPVLTHYATKQIVEAAEAAARKNDWPVTVAVCDEGGVPLALARLDGAMAASAELATQKARTAALFKKPTDGLESAANGQRGALVSSGFTVLGGGVPIMVDGFCVGAVGVSGVLPDQDAEVAAAGVAVVCPTLTPPAEEAPVKLEA